MRVKIILIAFIIALIVMNIDQCSRGVENIKVNFALRDSVRTYRNNLGQMEAEKVAVIIDNVEQLKQIKNLKGTNKRLQEQLNKRSHAGVSHDVITIVETKTDTVYVDTSSGKPVYTTFLNDEWRKGKIIASADSFSIDLAIKNKFDYRIETQRNLFRADTIKVIAVNLNPDTYTEDVSGAIIVPRTRRLNLGVGLQYGLTSSGFGLSVGVGVYYNLLRL